MNDLISRQAVLEATSAKLKITGKENAETVYKYIKKLCDDIKALPSADVVEVVRCEYCKYYVGEMFFGREVFWCNRKYKQGSGMMELTDADDFCSYGERKNE